MMLAQGVGERVHKGWRKGVQGVGERVHKGWRKGVQRVGKRLHKGLTAVTTQSAPGSSAS